MRLKIGNAQAFWGDQPLAARRLLERQPDLDVLTLDYLAEVSLSIMAIQRERDPSLSFAADFLETLRSLIPLWQKGLPFKLISNAGGLNPEACAERAASLLKKELKRPLKLALIQGDDVSDQIEGENLVAANAYFGARPIKEALDAGADLVITGRVCDPSLVVGPCLSFFGWSLDDYDRIASATVAGHLIECGTQATGGISSCWLELENRFDIGYPVVEMEESGSFVLTKAPGTGGAVTVETVKEQLLYEIGDPGAYLSPDATVSFLELEILQQGENRVSVRGAKGSAPPSSYKVSASYRAGYRAEALLAIYGRQAAKKAQLAGEALFARLELQGISFERRLIERIGVGEVVPLGEGGDPPEVMLRLAVADSELAPVERFAKEVASLVACGPPGTTGYLGGRPRPRPIFAYRPALIPVDRAEPKIRFLEV